MNRDVTGGTTVVLLYHRIGAPKLSSLVAGQYVAPPLFRWELDYLMRRGWQAVSLAEVASDVASDREAAEAHVTSDVASDCEAAEAYRNSETARDRFAVTFDDGYLSVYEHACPALAQRGIPATVYVVADTVGGINEWDHRAGDQKEQMMSARQVREISENGIEIGSHTLTHPHLTDLDDDQLRRELTDSKHKLEDMIGKEVVSFSYPYGDCDERVRQAALAAGYKQAVGTGLGVVVAETDMFEIPRVNVRWNAIGPLLVRKIGRAVRASGTKT